MAQKYGSYKNLIILVLVVITFVIGALVLFSNMSSNKDTPPKGSIPTMDVQVDRNKTTEPIDKTNEENNQSSTVATVDTKEPEAKENPIEEVNSEEPLTINDENTSTDQESSSPIPPIEPIVERVEPFIYSPKKPLSNAKLKAAVEMGAEGFNYFIIKVDKNKDWELKKSEYGYSLVYEEKSDIDTLTNGLKKYIAETVNFGVEPNNIHFLISSGALLKEETQDIIRAVKRNHYIPNEVTSENEGKYGFWATVPKEYRDSSFFVDIGSGNTKVAWLENGKLKTLSTYGAKYYLDGDKDEDVYTSVKDAVIDKIPETNRKRCFIIGGAPYKLAKVIRQDKEEYTTLYSPKTYLSDTQKYKTESKKLQSGLNIYQAIQDATQTTQFIFYWNTNFTIGYLLRLPY